MAIHTYNTIYKKSATGKTVIWYMEREADHYRTVSGQKDGKLTTGSWTTAKPKNIGKSNATTGVEQAMSEVESKYEKKIASGYHEKESQVDLVKFVKPMLAISYDKAKIKNWDNVLVQNKIDGVRCLVSKDSMMSRAGKPILGAPHILSSLKNFFDKNPNAILDGELYNHGLKDNFNKIVSIVRKEDPSKEELEESRKLVQYHIYDVASDTGIFSDRYKSYYFSKDYSSEYIVLVQSYRVANENNIMDFHNRFLELGYEGTIIRDGNGRYENKRSNGLIKLKNFQDEEFTILDIAQGKGNREGLAATVTCKNSNGKIFNPTVLGTFEYCEQVWKERDQYVGGQVTVDYFGITPDGIPRFPRAKALYKGGKNI